MKIINFKGNTLRLHRPAGQNIHRGEDATNHWKILLCMLSILKKCEKFHVFGFHNRTLFFEYLR